jgi:hypothetical protein
MEPNLDQSISTSYQRGKAYFQNRIRKGVVLDCSPGYVSGSCKGGHRFAAVQYCGREYCKDCGRDGSPIHQRRVNNWMNRISTWKEVGYLVATVPEAVRPLFYDKLILKDFRFKLLRKLKEDYKLSQGIARYHWFGDCENCSGKGCKLCDETGSGDSWNPHLNILLPTGYIENVPEYFTGLKKWICLYFRKLVDIEIERAKKYCRLNFSDAFDLLDYWSNVKFMLIPGSIVLNYSYVTEDKMKMNRVKYITRSTFRRRDADTKSLLYNFRNSIVYGWKKGESVIDEDQLTMHCPICAKNDIQHIVHWHRLSKFETNQQIKNYGTTTGRDLIRIRSGTNGDRESDTGFLPIIINRPSKKVSGFTTANIS